MHEIKNMLYNKSNWNGLLLQWDKYTFPFRPSKGDIRNYSLFLKQFEKKKKVLLLGSTPEIRKILSKFDSSIIVADFSFKMISGMLFFDKLIHETKEKWIKTDWMVLDEFLKNNYFDVIVGDLFLRNIDSELQFECSKKISKLLKKDGYLVTRIHFLNEKFVKLNSVEIIKSVFKNYFNLENKLIEDLITSRLFDKNTDFDNKIVNKKAFTSDIKKYIKKDIKNKREGLILNNILKKWSAPGNHSQRTWTQRNEKELKNLLSKNFTLCDTKIASDY